MSTRDYGLLEAAGISIAEVAKLFNRSRQAIYTGLSHERPYFSPENARTIVGFALATGKDATKVEGLIKFIDENFPQSEDALTESELTPERIGYERLNHFIQGADEVMVLFNGTLELLSPTATFARVVKDLLAEAMTVRFIVPGDWVIGYLEQNLAVTIPSHIVSRDFAHFPSFVLTKKQSTYAAFLFMRFSVAEMHASEAAELWSLASSMFEENSERKSLGSG